MGNTSKKYFEEKFKKEIWSVFLANVNKARSANELREVLEKVLTPNEIIMFEKRLGIINLLGKGLTYREIEKIIDVMPVTISFIKKGFKKPVKKKRKENIKYNQPGTPEWMLKKNSKMATSYSGKGRWKFLNG